MTDFYATVEMHLRVAGRFMDKARELINSGDYTLAGDMLDSAKAEHDEMLDDMKRMNAERAR